jgi:hypothetical protein
MNISTWQRRAIGSDEIQCGTLFSRQIQYAHLSPSSDNMVALRRLRARRDLDLFHLYLNKIITFHFLIDFHLGHTHYMSLHGLTFEKNVRQREQRRSSFCEQNDHRIDSLAKLSLFLAGLCGPRAAGRRRPPASPLSARMNSFLHFTNGQINQSRLRNSKRMRSAQSPCLPFPRHRSRMSESREGRTRDLGRGPFLWQSMVEAELCRAAPPCLGRAFVDLSPHNVIIKSRIRSIEMPRDRHRDLHR